MRRLRTVLLVTPALMVAGASGLFAEAPSGAAATRAAPASVGTITRSAHVAYLSCHAPDVLLTASIQRRAFASGQLVTYKVSLHNLSRTGCGYPSGITEPTTPSNHANPAAPVVGLLGPCGELPVQIENSHGMVVYPEIAEGCPMILGPPLAAGQTLTTTGTWDQSASIGFQSGVPLGPVPRGVYRIVIDQKVSLPVDLAGPPFLPPPATLPPRTNPRPTPTAPFQPLPNPPNLPAPTAPSHLSPPSRTPTTPTAPTGPTTPAPPKSSRHPETRSAHVAFDGCPAKAITVTVTIPAGSTASAPVRYDVAVHNGGNSPCGEAFRGDPGPVRRFRVGVCSSMPATFVNGSGVDVFPGPQVYMCPMFAGPYIAPHTTVTTTAVWPGTEYVASPGGGAPIPRAAPPGPYVLVVDGAVRVPFTLTASP